MSEYAISPLVVAQNPRFDSTDAAIYFNELANRYGRDETGLVWVAACLAYDELHADDPNYATDVNPYDPYSHAS